MPQFDSVTFLPQIFWLTLVFFAFYMVIIRGFLPGITRIVKLRKKILDAGQKMGDEFVVETNTTINNYEDLLVKSADSSRNIAGNASDAGSAWISETVDTLDHNTIKSLNEDYVKANGNITGKHHIITQIVKG